MAAVNGPKQAVANSSDVHPFVSPSPYSSLSGKTRHCQVKPGKSPQDINAGGGKDYFGCEQQPDSTTPTPGAFGTYDNYQGTGLKLTFTPSNGACDQSRFTLTNKGPNVYVLPPGESITFTIDMVTRKNKGNKQEYTSCGQHLLNSGFTVKWFQASDYPLLHSFSTNITPLYVDVIGCKP